MSEAETKESPTPRKRPRWRKKRWWCFAVLAITLVWLDGPGWRWLGQRMAASYLPDLGYEVKFDLEGRLTSGPIRVVGLELQSEGVVHQAAIEGLEIRYSLLEAIKGQVKAIELRGLDIEVDLAALPQNEEPEEEKPPIDLEKTLTDIRGRLLPVEVAIVDFAVRIRRGDEPVFALESSSLLHSAGSSEFKAILGAMSLPQDRRIPAQSPTITWEPDLLTIDQLALLEEISLANVAARPWDPIAYEGSLFIGKTQIDLVTDLKSIELDMKGPSISFAEVERIAKIELPVEGTLAKLNARVTNFALGTEVLNATASIGISDFNYDDWRSDTISLDAELAGPKVEATLELAPGQSPLTLKATAEIDRLNNFLPTSAQANITLAKMGSLLTVVRDRFTPGEDRPAPPDGALRIQASCTFDEATPQDVAATVAIIPTDEAPPINLKADWNPKEPVEATVEIPGLRIEGSFDPDAMGYKGTADLQTFVPESLLPWLQPFGISVPSGMQGTLAWSGSGEIKEVVHRGDLQIESFEWQNGDPAVTPLIQVEGSATYAWPESLALETLKVKSGDQLFTSKAVLAKQTLTIEELRWSEGEVSLADGTATIPLPENPADWKALLKETRPIQVDLKTPVLPLSKLHRFLPETVRFPEASTAELDIKLAGTPAAPQLDLSLVGKQLGLTSQSEVPPADLNFVAIGRESTLKLDGEIVVPGYPTATLSGVTSWTPDTWVVKPETATEAPIDAELRISNFNLEPFASKLPGTRKLSGQIDMIALVSGTVSKPVPTATVTLRNGNLDWHQASKPDINDATLELVVTEDQAHLKGLKLSMGAGTLDLSGTVALEEFKPSEIDLTLKAVALPLLRDDSMIVRASTDLSLQGPWESARLSGAITIVDSLLYKDFEILPIGGPINHAAEPSLPSVDGATPSAKLETIPEPFRNWGLDVSLATSNPFLIRGNLAGGEIYLDAKIGGTIGAPRPTGGAKLREVSAQLPFSTLEIPTGSVTFNPKKPFDPTLDIKGRSIVRPYELEVFIYGSVSDPKIQTSSNPPLPESEIMTLIATGTTTEGLANPSAATARAAQLVVEELRRGRLGAMKSMRPIFKLLDKVDFQVGETDAYSSKTFNSVTFNLDENWLLTAGVSEEGYTRAKVSYLLRFR